MFIKNHYDPAELLALQELDEVMKALKLNDVEVIEILLNDLKPFQMNLVQEWYNNFQENQLLAEAEQRQEDKVYGY
jgi:hypothetical protein